MPAPIRTPAVAPSRRRADSAERVAARLVERNWHRARGLARGPRQRFPAAGSKTPLLYAARAGDLAATKLLVERGAQLELADGNGVTPLLEAVLNANAFRVKREGRTDHLAVASALLDAGANVDAMDWYGEAPLWAAVDLRNLELGPADKRTGVRDEALALIGRLLDGGANPNARTKEYPPERRYITTVVGSVAGWISPGRRRSCGPPRPAISPRCGYCSRTARTRTSRPQAARRR